MKEQEVLPHKDNASQPETTVVPPGESGKEQTTKQGGANPAENDKENNAPGKPAVLPSNKLDPRL